MYNFNRIDVKRIPVKTLFHSFLLMEKALFLIFEIMFLFLNLMKSTRQKVYDNHKRVQQKLLLILHVKQKYQKLFDPEME